MGWTKILKFKSEEREERRKRLESYLETGRGLNPDNVYEKLEDKILDVMVEVANDNFNVGASKDSFEPRPTNAGLKELFKAIMIYVEEEEKGD